MGKGLKKSFGTCQGDSARFTPFLPLQPFGPGAPWALGRQGLRGMPSPVEHMANIICRRELVAMFMESPFYFELSLRERLTLVQQHEWRCAHCDGRTHCTATRAVTVYYQWGP